MGVCVCVGGASRGVRSAATHIPDMARLVFDELHSIVHELLAAESANQAKQQYIKVQSDRPPCKK